MINGCFVDGIGNGFIVFKTEKTVSEIASHNYREIVLASDVDGRNKAIDIKRYGKTLTLEIKGKFCAVKIDRFLDLFKDEIEYAEISFVTVDDIVHDYEVDEGELNYYKIPKINKINHLN